MTTVEKELLNVIAKIVIGDLYHATKALTEWNDGTKTPEQILEGIKSMPRYKNSKF